MPGDGFGGDVCGCKGWDQFRESCLLADVGGERRGEVGRTGTHGGGEGGVVEFEGVGAEDGEEELRAGWVNWRVLGGGWGAERGKLKGEGGE